MLDSQNYAVMPNQVQMMNQVNQLGLANNVCVEDTARKTAEKILTKKDQDNKVVMQVNKYIPHY
tara:strand:+ start:513 stop:704 length:192 start_codon:yes stop_codon:yes gene_type:complete